MREPTNGTLWGQSVVTVATNTQIVNHTVNSRTINIAGIKKGQSFLCSADFPMASQGLFYAAESVNDDEVVFSIFNAGNGTFTFTQDVHFTINIEPVG